VGQEVAARTPCPQHARRALSRYPDNALFYGYRAIRGSTSSTAHVLVTALSCDNLSAGRNPGEWYQKVAGVLHNLNGNPPASQDRAEERRHPNLTQPAGWLVNRVASNRNQFRFSVSSITSSRLVVATSLWRAATSCASRIVSGGNHSNPQGVGHRIGRFLQPGKINHGRTVDDHDAG